MKTQRFIHQSTHSPLVVLPTFEQEGKKVFERVQAQTDHPFQILEITDLDWDNDCSPWPAKGFDGKAKDRIQEIDKILPGYDRTETYLAGYSLAGLMALYATYQTDTYRKIMSASGSFWFEGWLDFVQEATMKRIPDAIYFSLGDREAKTRHPLMKQVQVNTEATYEKMKEQGIRTILEWNPGNHFKDTDQRTAKGILWLLEG